MELSGNMRYVVVRLIHSLSSFLLLAGTANVTLASFDLINQYNTTQLTCENQQTCSLLSVTQKYVCFEERLFYYYF